MKKKGKIIASVLSVLLIVASVIFSALQIGKAEDTAGKITLSKTAVATSDRKAKVTLEIHTSELKQSTADIVLVVDTSGSMDEEVCASNKKDCNEKIKTAREQAKKLTEQLLPENASGTVRLGVVSFGTDYKANQSTIITKTVDGNDVSVLGLTSNKSIVTDAINKLSANGGTNVQIGLQKAKELLQESTADTKIVILISDGEPTYFSDSTGNIHGTGVSDKHETCDTQFSESGAKWQKVEDKENYETQNCVEKDGTIIETRSRSCRTCNWRTTYQNEDLLIPSEAALKESNAIKGNSIKAEIYAVGFGQSANSIAGFLKDVASTNTSEKTYTYTASDTTALETAMNSIAKSIKNTLATNATVTDIVPESFQLTAEAKKALQDKYGDDITLIDNEDGTTTIKVHYDEISSVQGTYKIEYEVIADEDHYGAMYTNVEATFEATATEDNTYYQDKEIKETFNQPVVAISSVTKDDDYTTNDKYIVKEGNSITITKEDRILNNDSFKIHTDKPTDALADSTVKDEIVIDSEPTCGTLTINQDGTFTYNAVEGCAGTNSAIQEIKYHINSEVTIDGQKYNVTSNTSTITIKVVKDETSYTVKYLEQGTDKELSATKTVDEQYVYDNVTEKAISITGYNLANGEESEKQIKLSKNENENIIIFYYTIKPANVEDPTVSKQGPTSIESAKEKVDYTISYKTTIEDYKGTATITIVDTLPYTIDVEKSNIAGGKYDAATKTITWVEKITNINTYENGTKNISIVKEISVLYNYPEFNGTELNVSNKVNTNITVDTAPEKEKEITEDTPVDIKGKLVVEHLYIDEDGQEKELVPTQPAKEEKIGTEYTTSSVKVDGYKVSKTPTNATGKYVEGTTTVKYYYERVEAEITDTDINKTSETEEIKSSKDEVTYNVTYKTTIKEYNGPVTITIVDTLPYEIDLSKSNLTSGAYVGKYNATNKTITWVINKNVDTYANKPEGTSSSAETISISLKYTVVYKDLDAKADKVVNKVNGNIKVETTDPIDTNDSEEIPVNINGKVITHHIDEAGNTLSSDVETTDKVGKTYTTKDVEIPGYKLTKQPDNANGQYIEGTIEVTYVYKRLGATPTNPVVTKTGTTEITNSTDKNEYTITYDAIVENYEGNVTITIVDTLPYELDETKENKLDGGIYNAEDKTITWTHNFTNENALEDLVIDITKNITVYYKNIDASIKEYTNNVKVTLSDDVTETTDDEKETSHKTEVNIKGNVTTHYYIKDTTTKLKDSITTTDKVGVTYETEAADIEGYNIVSKTPENYKGKYTEKDIVVIYEYTRKIADINEEKITKKSVLEEITASNTLVDYQIVYTAKIKDYKGTATVTIVDYLPYAIDKKSSNLDGGIYNAEDKTITWTETIEGINTFQNGDYSVNVTKNIVVKYNNMASDKEVINKVTGKVNTETNNSEGTNAEEEIIASIKGDLIVKHIYKDEAGNEKVLEIEDTKTDYVGYTYTTESKHFDGYTVSQIPENKTGEYTEEDTIVIYYYNRIPAEVVENIIDKIATNTIVTNINDAFKYTINYQTTLNEYEGKAIITIVDQLPYAIDVEKSDIADGIYDAKNLTITWTKEYNVNTYKKINNELDINIELTLYYKDLTSNIRVIENKVNTKLELETIDPITSADQTETKVEVKGAVIVNYIDEFGNKLIDSITLTDLVGEKYQTEEKEFEGYIFSKVEGTTEGEYIDGTIEVTYYYELEGTGNVEPELPPETRVDSELNYISLVTTMILSGLILIRKKILN